MDDNISVFISEEEIAATVGAVAARINADYASDAPLVLVAVLKGSVVFLADLMRAIKRPYAIDFLRASSYGSGKSSSGKVSLSLDVSLPLEGADVLIVEDICDSGHTLSLIVEHLKGKGARSVRTCVLLDKPSRREVDFTPEYIGLSIADEFVVGYGLDFDERYRGLPFVGIMNT